MSKGFYCFSKEINDKELKELKINGTIRNSISSLSKSIWVYTLENDHFILLNGKPFQSQQEMLRSLNLNRVRTINKYKDAGINFKGYYFFSKQMSNEEWNKLNKNIYAKPSKKAMLVWVYKDNKLIKNRPFLSMTAAGCQRPKELNLNRKLIRKYLDSNQSYNGFLIFSSQKG